MCVAKMHSLFVVLGCLATLAVGALLLAIGLNAIASRSFLEATHIVLADTKGDGDGIRIDLDLLINIIIVTGGVAIVASLAGLIGACRHSKSLLCLYSFSAILFGALFIASGIGMLMIFETMGPKIREHVNHYCNDDVYPSLLSQLKHDGDTHCGDVNALPTVNVLSGPVPTTISVRLLSEVITSVKEATPAKSCGPTCQQQVGLIHTMGGCRTLRYLCTNHHHKTTSTNHEDPAVVRRFELYARALVVTLLSFGSFLLLSMVCTFCFMYTLGTGRQGKKGAQSLLMRLFCPCLRKKSFPYEHKRLRGHDEEYDVE